jgi:hypothetical protein
VTSRWQGRKILANERRWPQVVESAKSLARHALPKIWPFHRRFHADAQGLPLSPPASTREFPEISDRIDKSDTPRVGFATVEFEQPFAHQFGPPNDEAFLGHPLAERGLHPYAGFEVQNSSWVRALEEMNYRVVGVGEGPLSAVVPEVLQSLGRSLYAGEQPPQPTSGARGLRSVEAIVSVARG